MSRVPTVPKKELQKRERRWHTQKHYLYRHQKYLEKILREKRIGNFITRNGTQENENRYEEPMARPNTDDEHHHLMENVSSGLIVCDPGSQVSAQVQALLYPQPSDILASLLTPTRVSFLVDAPAPSTLMTTFWSQKVRKSTVGTEECLKNSISRAGIPSLASITNFLGAPKGFLYIHALLFSCPPFSNRWHNSFSALSKKKKK